MTHTMDCTDIKVLLSALVDDEITAETRHHAERHLAQCDECRTQLEEVEALGDLIVSDATGIGAASGLSDDFVGAVLGRTVYARPEVHTRPFGWLNALGWVAAAAALALAATIWIMDRSGTDPRVPSEGVVVSTTPVDPPDFRSDVLLDLPVDPVARELLPTEDDLDTLDAVSLLIERLTLMDPNDTERLGELRGLAEYDDLLTRLSALLPRLDAFERPDVEIAEGILLSLVHGPVDPVELQGRALDTQVAPRLMELIGRHSGGGA